MEKQLEIEYNFIFNINGKYIYDKVNNNDLSHIIINDVIPLKCDFSTRILYILNIFPIAFFDKNFKNNILECIDSINGSYNENFYNYIIYDAIDNKNSRLSKMKYYSYYNLTSTINLELKDELEFLSYKELVNKNINISDYYRIMYNRNKKKNIQINKDILLMLYKNYNGENFKFN